MAGLSGHAAIIVFPILFVVITLRIVFYFLERKKSPPPIPKEGAGKNQRSKKLNAGMKESQEKIPESINVKSQTGPTAKPEHKKRIKKYPGGQISAQISNQEQKQSIPKPEKQVSEKGKAPSVQWGEIEKKWAQIKNNDSFKIVREILGPPTSLKRQGKDRELWVYVYGMKEKRTLTFNCGLLEKTEIGENVFAKALIDLHAKKGNI